MTAAALTTLRRRIDRATTVVELETARLEAATTLASELAERVMASDVALHAIRSVQELSTARVQQRLTELATEALRVVFDDPDVSLVVRTQERRGVAEADLLLRRGDLETDPLLSNGGGLVNELSAVLRLIMVRMLVGQGLAQIILLDEPFSALSKGHRPAMAETLEALAAALGIQVFVVTHSEVESRGRVYEMRWVDRERQEAGAIDISD